MRSEGSGSFIDKISGELKGKEPRFNKDMDDNGDNEKIRRFKNLINGHSEDIFNNLPMSNSHPSLSEVTKDPKNSPLIVRRKSNLRRSRTAENLMDTEDLVLKEYPSTTRQATMPEIIPSRNVNIHTTPEKQSPRIQYEQKFKLDDANPHPKYLDKNLTKLIGPERRSSDPSLVKERKTSLDSDLTRRVSSESPFQTPNGSPEITRRIHRKRTGSNLSNSEIFREDKILKDDSRDINSRDSRDKKDKKKEKKEKKRKQEKVKEKDKFSPNPSPSASPQHTMPINIRSNVLEIEHFSF